MQATNSQTALGTSALRATDKVQRQIEEHLRSQGLYYERRKNYYHNRSIPLNKLVSIDQMGQAVMSILVQVPHIARGEVSSIFSDEVYYSVFDNNHPIEMYSVAITLLRRTEEFLKSSPDTRADSENFVFHLAMFAAVAMTRKMVPKPSDLAESLEIPSDRRFRELLSLVREEFRYVAERKGEVLFERVAKDPFTSKRLQDRAQRFLLTSPRG
ncbi:AIPR family protein [Aeromicrobium sp. Leaf289]|uniref:AIPR family protein n=1 Tax=Aeromicrobium sp. Leaf289 TaxID=1736324 RepID=UPI00351467F2